MKQLSYYESIHDHEPSLRFFYGENSNMAAHFHRCIEMLYISGGSVLCTADDKEFLATKDDIIFVGRYTVHGLKAAPSYKNYVLIIKSQYDSDFADLFNKKTLPPHLSDKDFNRTLLPLFLEFEKEETCSSLLMSKGYINVIMAKLLSHYEKIPIVSMPNMPTIISVLDYIDTHYAEPLTLESLASIFGYNKYYFSKLFNSHIGENINCYINRVRINHALALIQKQNSMNLSDAVFSCGFEALSTFYRNYSRFYKTSPTKLLKESP